MSQERIRFPIQPKDRRRSALSSKDKLVHGAGQKGGKPADPDKPTVPPHRRHERDEPALGKPRSDDGA